jgi:hypothetical protein
MRQVNQGIWSGAPHYFVSYLVANVGLITGEGLKQGPEAGNSMMM